jgi:hypothetical protein
MPIIGGRIDSPEQDKLSTAQQESHSRRAAKRRVRLDLILKEYEDHIMELEVYVQRLIEMERSLILTYYQTEHRKQSTA